MDLHDQWWRDAVIYEIYVRSYADRTGDGVGDIAGIRSRLDHLRALGVDAIWVTPWYRSPMADGGYDVADYRDIDPLFGTLADAEALIDDVHRNGMRIIVDLVPNHTSNQHPWFREALDAGPGSAERDRYVFRAGRGPGEPPNDWRSVFGGPAWTQVADGEWYLHLFAPEQPDLNWRDPRVRAEFEDILRFWLDRGVDGFRIDVAHGLVKAEGLPDLGGSREDLVEPPDRGDHPHWDRPEVHDIYRAWRRITEEYGPDRVFVAEAWVDRPDRLARYVRPDELHTAFNFDFLRCDWSAESFRTVIDANLAALGAVGAPATWVLSNHDVTRHVTRYGRPHSRGAGPLTEPLEPADLALGTRRARAALLLMLALPGSAYLYQGEELGLEEVEDLPADLLRDPTWHRSGHTVRGRDGCRVPIPWEGGTPPFGFTAPEVEPWLPQPPHWRDRTAAAEQTATASMLTLYREALRIRHQHKSLGDGDLTWLDTDTPPEVLLFRRNPDLLCAVNLGPTPWRLPEHSEVLLASTPVDNATLPPDAAVWLAS
ncbi:glycoside hydrolase family 13 protein [Actinophytocola sp.]|uniref:glycoside hydrolase family 13 protein n=1 Tax=Actinophytocola sp. TaxID=1872138 RepID=UPI00389A01B7